MFQELKLTCTWDKGSCSKPTAGSQLGDLLCSHTAYLYTFSLDNLEMCSAFPSTANRGGQANFQFSNLVLLYMGHPGSRFFWPFVGGGSTDPFLATSVPSTAVGALQHFCTEEQRSLCVTVPAKGGAHLCAAGLNSPAAEHPSTIAGTFISMGRIKESVNQAGMALLMQDWSAPGGVALSLHNSHGPPWPGCRACMGTGVLKHPQTALHPGPELHQTDAQAESTQSVMLARSGLAAPEGALWPVFLKLHHKDDQICTRSGQESQQSHGLQHPCVPSAEREERESENTIQRALHPVHSAEGYWGDTGHFCLVYRVVLKAHLSPGVPL